MAFAITWWDITLRLFCTVLAGIMIGFNRGEHGRPAGLRTTLLVCLAASLAMIQANLLMASTGKSSDSFVVLDLMRLPLGILSGMGFIGAGAIIRRGSLVVGMTTAATMWFVTVMGLCFGGGNIALGFGALMLGLATLWGLKYVEGFMEMDARAALNLTVASDGPSDVALRDQIAANGCAIKLWAVSFVRGADHREIICEFEWRRREGEYEPAGLLEMLKNSASIKALQWRPQGTPRTEARDSRSGE